jgi:hypothetical protein
MSDVTDIKCTQYRIFDKGLPADVTTVTYNRNGIPMSARWPGHVNEEYMRYTLSVYDQRFKDQLKRN